MLPERPDLPRRPAPPDAQLPPKKRRTSLSDDRDVTVPERAAQREEHLQELRRLHLFQPETPAQGQLQMPLEGEGPSAPTPAHDQLKKKAPEDMTSKLHSLVNLVKTLKSAHQEVPQPIREPISRMIELIKARDQDQKQKAYEVVVRSIKDLVSKETTAPNIQKACQMFLAEVEPQPQGKSYAWQGRTDSDAIRNLTQSFQDRSLVDAPALAAQRAHLKKLNQLPFLPSQDQLKMPLEGEGPSAPTPAHDQLKKKAPEDMISKLHSLVNLVKTLTRDDAHQEELQPIREPISRMIELIKARDQDQKQKAYEVVVRSIKDLVSKETTAPNIQKACQMFLAEVEPQPQGKPYAEQGRIDPEAIGRLTQSFLDAACRPKLPAGQQYPPLGIFLTDAQYSKVFLHLRELKGSRDIPRTIYDKARKMAYQASDKGKAAVARYRANNKGKAAIARYRANDKGRAASARYRASDQGRAASARYHASDNRKAAQARYRANDKGKAAVARYSASNKGKATRRRKHHEKQTSASKEQEMGLFRWKEKHSP